MKKFSEFTLREALNYANLKDFEDWEIEISEIPTSETFEIQRRRLVEHFDLESTEAGHELLIDLFLSEAIDPFDHLKIWKEASLTTEKTKGQVDYLLAEKGAVFEALLLAIGEAKKEDFEKGTAQCISELKACVEWNQKRGFKVDPIYGVVTNGQLWQFFKYWGTEGPNSRASRSALLAASTSTPTILGWLNKIFILCSKNLSNTLV